MFIGIVMLFILKSINAPVWCFVLVWVHIVLRMVKFVLVIGNRKERAENVEDIQR